MLYCKTCGQQVSETEQYCPNCGAKIEATVPNHDVNQGFNAAPASIPTNNPPSPNPGYNPNQGYNPGYNQAPGYNPNQGYNQAPGYNPGYNQGYNPNQGYPGYNQAPGYAQPQRARAPRPVGSTGFSALGSNMVIFFISVGLLLMNIIFMYCPNVTASSFYYDDSASVFAGASDWVSGFGFMIFFGILLLLAYIGGMVLCMLPIMTNKRWNGKVFICGRVACIVGLSLYLLGVIILAGSTSYRVSVYPNFVGWLFMLTNIGGIVLSVVVPKMMRNSGAFGAPAAPAPVPPVYNPPQY